MQRADIRSRNRWYSTTGRSLGKKSSKAKSKGKSKSKSNLDAKIMRAVKKNAIASQDTQVQYFHRVSVNNNPSEGIYNPICVPINPPGMDALLPNYGTYTEGSQQIYIDYINIFIIYEENDTELNDVRRNFIRHFITYKDDLTDTSVAELSAKFKSNSQMGIVAESITAVFPQSSELYNRHDSGWIKYDAERGTSLSTGATITDVPNFHYPTKKYTISLKVQKNFQIAGNGSLLDWRQPTVCCLFTGSPNSEPDVTVGYHVYYKVLA